MQSGDGDALISVPHRLHTEKTFSSLRRALTDTRLPQALRLRLRRSTVISTLRHGCESGQLTRTEKDQRPCLKNAGKMTGRSNVEEATTPTCPVLLWIREKRWACLEEIVCMNENRLIRRVRLSCVPVTSSSIFGDISALSVEWAIDNATHERESSTEIDN